MHFVILSHAKRRVMCSPFISFPFVEISDVTAIMRPGSISISVIAKAVFIFGVSSFEKYIRNNAWGITTIITINATSINRKSKHPTASRAATGKAIVHHHLHNHCLSIMWQMILVLILYGFVEIVSIIIKIMHPDTCVGCTFFRSVEFMNY